MLTHITINCACGAVIGSHSCSLPRNAVPPPTWTEEEIESAMTVAFRGTVPQYIWDDVLETLTKLRNER